MVFFWSFPSDAIEKLFELFIKILCFFFNISRNTTRLHFPGSLADYLKALFSTLYGYLRVHLYANNSCLSFFQHSKANCSFMNSILPVIENSLEFIHTILLSIRSIYKTQLCLYISYG